MLFRLFISLVSIFLLSFGPTLAQESKEAQEPKKTKAAPSISLEGYIPVQLRPFSVPVALPDGGLGRGTITMFVVVRGQKDVATFCHYLPRVREVLTLTADNTPVPIVQNQYQLQDIGERLHQSINRILPSPLIVNLHLLPVGWAIGKGAVDLELRGTNTTCMALQEIPADVLAMLEANKKVGKSHTIKKPARSHARSKKIEIPIPQPASRPDRPKYALPSVTVQARKSDIQIEDTYDPANCRNLKKIWPAGFHQVSGRQYWLGQTFTLDDNNDDIVDNVGFVLRADERPDLYIYYFPGQGRQSVITVPTLRVADNREVRRACAGQEEYDKPDGDGPSPREMAADTETEQGAAKPNHGLFNGLGFIFVIAIGVGVLMIVLAGVYFVASKRKSERRRQERRRQKNRRSQDRRGNQEPLEGDDQRKINDRREIPEKRQADSRSEEPDKKDIKET
ncbi:MAG: hypothetical protein HQ494_02630 [Rhodospirillales bacterium]|nr:hypothetical protein [Rhodospirillales bacterium]